MIFRRGRKVKPQVHITWTPTRPGKFTCVQDSKYVLQAVKDDVWVLKHRNKDVATYHNVGSIDAMVYASRAVDRNKNK